MKVSLEEFEELVRTEQIQSISFGIYTFIEESITIAQKVIESLKLLNSKDPKFCYTCKCNNMITVWSFGYSDPEILKQVSEIIIEHFPDTKKQVGNYRQCECMFEGA